jgi:hypothetical protein
MNEEPKKQGQPRTAEPGEAVSGFPEPPGKDPGDRSKDPTPHHSLNTPVGEPDPTEWPDPYDKRPDPRGPESDDGHTPTGATSTSEPHPSKDPEAPDWEGPKRDKVDD